MNYSEFENKLLDFLDADNLDGALAFRIDAEPLIISKLRANTEDGLHFLQLLADVSGDGESYASLRNFLLRLLDLRLITSKQADHLFGDMPSNRWL